MGSGQWLTRFPALAGMTADCAALLAASGIEVSLPAGARVYDPGGEPASFLLVTSGSVIVRQVSESGREIVLYRVTGGESCMLTTACILGGDTYPAEAVTETDVAAIALPRATFEDLLARSAEFRHFVFQALSGRIVDMFHLVEQVAFSRVDSRLAIKLLELSHGGETVTMTQAQLAAELGTAREVVTRALAEFQRLEWVSLARGSLHILNRKALEVLAHRA